MTCIYKHTRARKNFNHTKRLLELTSWSNHNFKWNSRKRRCGAAIFSYFPLKTSKSWLIKKNWQSTCTFPKWDFLNSTGLRMFWPVIAPRTKLKASSNALLQRRAVQNPFTLQKLSIKPVIQGYVWKMMKIAKSEYWRQLLNIFGFSSFHWKDRNLTVLSSTLLHKEKTAHWGFESRSHVGSFWVKWAWRSRKLSIIRLFGYLCLREFRCEEKIPRYQCWLSFHKPKTVDWGLKKRNQGNFFREVNSKLRLIDTNVHFWLVRPIRNLENSDCGKRQKISKTGNLWFFQPMKILMQKENSKS